jgi:hypothetical protein
MTNASAATQAIGLSRLLRRGPYTNCPHDEGYGNHHYAAPLRADEVVRQAYPATIVARGHRTYGTVRQTDTGFYVDPARMPRTGLLGPTSSAALSRAGLTAGRRYRLDDVRRAMPAANRLRVWTPDGVEVLARTDGYVGRPADLSPLGRLRNVWRFARG